MGMQRPSPLHSHSRNHPYTLVFNPQSSPFYDRKTYLDKCCGEAAPPPKGERQDQVPNTRRFTHRPLRPPKEPFTQRGDLQKTFSNHSRLYIHPQTKPLAEARPEGRDVLGWRVVVHTVGGRQRSI